ncbi:hypothetical protein GF420_07390 [candidate division GN15 bacterium]|nr:hypothetical protein [candidate division GN15 bacterium]
MIQDGGSRRARGGRGRRGGKGALTAGSLAGALVVAAIRDLSRPNSLILGLIESGRKKLAEWRTPPPSRDISDSVEIRVGEDGDAT